MWDDVVREYLDVLNELVTNEEFGFNGNLHGDLSTLGGVYRIMKSGDDSGGTLYVGMAKNLQDRIYYNLLMGDRGAHTLRDKLIRRGVCINEQDLTNYLRKNCVCQYRIIDRRQQRCLFEHFAISILKPEFND